jgi:hypothetical protein
MFDFFKSFFGKNKPSAKKIYVAPKAPDNINDITALKSPLEENILNNFFELSLENKYEELENKINKIKDNKIIFNEDFGFLVTALSSKGNEIKDESAINIAKTLIGKIDKNSVIKDDYLDLLWSIANNRTGETTSAIFKNVFDELLKDDYKQSDFDNLKTNIKGMSKGSPETLDLDILPDEIKVKIKCDLNIIEIIKEKFEEKEQEISNSPRNSPSVLEYSKNNEKFSQLG